jgi:hypothetical protein
MKTNQLGLGSPTLFADFFTSSSAKEEGSRHCQNDASPDWLRVGKIGCG